MKKNTKDSIRIKLVGWYGMGGLGDDLIAHCIKQNFEKVANEEEIQIVWNHPTATPDLFVVGGGSILGKDYVGFMENKLLAEALEVPMVTYGSGFRQEKALGQDEREALNGLLDYCSLVGLRGEFSRKNLGKGEVIGDPIFSFVPSKKFEFTGLWNLGIVVRQMSQYEEQYVDNKEIQQMFAEMTDYMVEQCKAKPFFFSFTENPTDSDYAGYCNTNMLMRNHTTNVITYTGDALRTGNFVSGMDYMLSQRLHPMLLSWISGHPSIGFEYQFGKTSDCMETIHMQDWVMKTSEYDFEKFKKMFEKLVENKDELTVTSQNAIRSLREKQMSFTRRCLALVK